jgi:uncharacterized protein YidB (DUF937 family)
MPQQFPYSGIARMLLGSFADLLPRVGAKDQLQFFLGELQMGLLDEVIGAALRSRAGSGQSAQSQSAQSQSAQGQPAEAQYSQIAAALTKLLASSAAAASAGRAAAPSVGQQSSPGGLDVLLRQFQQNGFGEIIKSWIGTGQNQAISPTQLRQAIGQETVNDLSRQTGAPQDDLLSQLSKYLPGVIDKLTPNGQLPNQSDLLPGPRIR